MKRTADPFEGSASATVHAPCARTGGGSASVQIVEATIPENISPDQLVGYDVCTTEDDTIYLHHNYKPCDEPWFLLPDEDEGTATVADLIAAVRIHVRKHHD